MTTRRLEARTELAGFLHGREWSHHGPVEHPFGTQIGSPYDRVPSGELIRVFCLQTAE